MVLIISKRSLDYTTEEVIDWIDYYKGEYLRINGDDLYDVNSNLTAKMDTTTSIKYKGIDIYENTYENGWYRRWSEDYVVEDIKRINQFPNTVYDSLVSVFRMEEATLKNFFLPRFKVKNWLTAPNQGNVNKLNVLKLASDIKIKIPNTYICSTKSELLKIYDAEKQLIIKSLDLGVIIKDGDYIISQYTEEVTLDFINNLDESFLPTLFQKKIEKEYEIRSFYLDGDFYSMCIFSQLDKQTSVDFRKYNFDNPNRNVPYTLPKELEQKLATLMKYLNLKTGSIDIIKGKDGEFYFLEINPVGQIGMTSHPCNFQLEKRIANYLLKEHGRNNKNSKE